MLIYLDDIVVYSHTFTQHLRHLEDIFKRLRASGLKLKPEKCTILKKQFPLLGHTITIDGVTVLESQIDKIRDFPIPLNATEVRSFLGLAGYYSQFVEHFADKARPLRLLIRKGVAVIWTPETQTAFDTLKKALISAPILIRPDPRRQFILHTDASDYGLGVVLGQQDDQKRERVIAYGSKALSGAELNYPTTEKEFYAVYWSVTKHYSHYLRGAPFTVVTDHQPLVSMMCKDIPHGRVGRWIAKLQGYQMNLKYRPGRLNQNADAPSRIRTLRPMTSIKGRKSVDQLKGTPTQPRPQKAERK
jgi:hypothetical protein